VLVGILFGISGYYMIARPIHSAGPDAKPVAALVVGVLFAASVALAGIVLIRRGRR
jgi:drug/metabolite transporter (DMT)-like permease